VATEDGRGFSAHGKQSLLGESRLLPGVCDAPNSHNACVPSVFKERLESNILLADMIGAAEPSTLQTKTKAGWVQGSEEVHIASTRFWRSRMVVH